MTPLTQAPLDATGRNPQAPALAPGRATPNLPDGLALWAGREEFLTWCRERGVKGNRSSPLSDCLCARALRIVTGNTWIVTLETAWEVEGNPAARFLLPAWMGSTIRDWCRNLLPEFTEC